MTSKLPPTSEADLKRTVQDFLTIQEAQGKLFWLRLNAGMLISEYKGKRWAVNLCRPGTADFEVLRLMEFRSSQSAPFSTRPFCQVIFLELKAPKGKQTKAQQEFQEAVERQGASYWVIQDLEELQRRLGNGR